MHVTEYPPPQLAPFAAREPLTTLIANQLLSYLLDGDLKPGDRMPSERRLAESMAVGRGAVREAIKALALLGLVEIRPGSGTFLKRAADSGVLSDSIEWGLLLGVQRLRDLIEARGYLEVLLAGLAAERRRESDCESLGEALEKMQQAGHDNVRFTDADLEFHTRIWVAADNSSLSQVMSSIRMLLQAWISRVMLAEEDPSRTVGEHRPIYEAIVARDVNAAHFAMASHMTSARGRLMRTIPHEAWTEGNESNERIVSPWTAARKRREGASLGPLSKGGPGPLR
jgi:GntR family transcriptional repressor for pyruvate dehydrogenase complex